MKLRPVTEQDCTLLFDWANDTDVRSMSVKRAAIDWESHCRWFRQRLDDPGCWIFIGLDDAGEPFGQIRFDRRGPGVAETGISIDRRFRGRGFGSELIRRGVRMLFELSDVDTVHALIRKENPASRKAFRGAGFVHLMDERIDDGEYERLACRR